ncbi:auxin-repressed 12.5 kDa protein-like [Canna indica]|uniref:Auxin-repressed 12.5 kDa protein-like n=1 Tax=Canna indica TaxID=4628 RepID=A0AAQ3K5U1_9LILI|nr:auxin-repressed 12.5 kDa protein-like [Canna indica]
MVLLDKMWDDVLAGPQPERGLGKLRKVSVPKPLSVKEGESKFQRSISLPQTPTTPTTPATPSSSSFSPTQRQGNVWRSVFNPGSNLATKTLGADLFDKPQPNTPTVYDWLYSRETKSTHR